MNDGGFDLRSPSRVYVCSCIGSMQHEGEIYSAGPVVLVRRPMVGLAIGNNACPRTRRSAAAPVFIVQPSRPLKIGEGGSALLYPWFGFE